MTIPHRNPGDKRLPASDYNQLVDAANFVQRNRPKFEAGTNELEGRTPGTILIKNNTGADRARGDAVGIGSQLFDLDYYTVEMKNTSFFSGESLAANYIGRFAILAEPIKEDEVGEAYIALECYAKIWIPDGATLETHGYADVFDITTSPNNLTALSKGACQIIWFDNTASDELGDAKVRFHPKDTPGRYFALNPSAGAVVSGNNIYPHFAPIVSETRYGLMMHRDLAYTGLTGKSVFVLDEDAGLVKFHWDLSFFSDPATLSFNVYGTVGTLGGSSKQLTAIEHQGGAGHVSIDYWAVDCEKDAYLYLEIASGVSPVDMNDGGGTTSSFEAERIP